MSRLRRILGGGRELVAAIVRPFLPEPGTTEGAVMLGLLLVAGGFALAELMPLALIVPGAVLVVIGALPVLRRPR